MLIENKRQNTLSSFIKFLGFFIVLVLYVVQMELALAASFVLFLFCKRTFYMYQMILISMIYDSMYGNTVYNGVFVPYVTLAALALFLVKMYIFKGFKRLFRF